MDIIYTITFFAKKTIKSQENWQNINKPIIIMQYKNIYPIL